MEALVLGRAVTGWTGKWSAVDWASSHLSRLNSASTCVPVRAFVRVRMCVCACVRAWVGGSVAVRVCTPFWVTMLVVGGDVVCVESSDFCSFSCARGVSAWTDLMHGRWQAAILFRRSLSKNAARPIRHRGTVCKDGGVTWKSRWNCARCVHHCMDSPSCSTSYELASRVVWVDYEMSLSERLSSRMRIA